MLATLIGWKIAGWTGAIVASLALFVPSSLLCYRVFRWSNAHREKHWLRAVREGLAPVETGLIIAGVFSILQLSGGAVSSVLIAIASAVLLIFLPRVPALAVISFGGFAALALCKI